MRKSQTQRLEELRSLFTIMEVNGSDSPAEVIAETIAIHLNKKYGRQVVVPRDRKVPGR